MDVMTESCDGTQSEQHLNSLKAVYDAVAAGGFLGKTLHELKVCWHSNYHTQLILYTVLH